MSGHRLQVPIAVVGVSALFPGSSDAQGFWSDILAGRDLITDVPASHWLIDDYYDPNPAAPDKTYCKRGAFLSPVDFDPMEFGLPPTIVPATDSAQILALIVAQKVLEDASQGQFKTMDRERISVMLGVTSAQELLGSMVSRLQRPVWIKALRESGMPEAEAQAICDRMAKSYVPWQESSFPGLLGNVVAGRIANRFDLRGTNAVTDAACASSMAAVSMGINELQLGQADLVITGGVDTLNDIFMFMCFSKTPALSPTGDCRPFSDVADGTILGEGMAMIALKRLEDAERDGDRVYAVIRGVGTASDGRSKSVYAPVPEGQARAITRAYEVAGYGPETVELVEGHGTGTKAGDAAEFEGLRIAFGASAADKKQWCALGSVKSQIGHTKAAAGAAGLFKAIMALHHKVLPPTIKIDRPNPKLDIDSSPFYLSTARRPWIRSGEHPRRAAVSSFGFGGSNFHITLEEFVPSAKAKPAFRYRAAGAELVLLSGATGGDVAAKCQELAKSLSLPATQLSAVARKAQAGFRSVDTARLAIVASTTKELAEKLTQTAETLRRAPTVSFRAPGGVTFAADSPSAGKIAFLYPGQGSQYVGMGGDVAMTFDAARAPWDTAASIDFGGTAIQDVVFPRPAFTDEARAEQAKLLTRTEWAQPALGLVSLALENLLAAVGVRPSCVAGHSFGEVKALHAAGVLSDADLLKVARRRGELMRDAASVSGAMTAIPLPKAEVAKLLAELRVNAVIANHNAPTQVVVSGETDAIVAIEQALAKRDITAKRLPVATAFHSPLVASSSAPLLEFLEGISLRPGEVPVYSNAEASPYPSEPATIRKALAAQLGQPVLFVEQIEAMYAAGVRTFIEVGAGAVLTELVGRILGERPHQAVNLDRNGKNGLESLADALGRLAVAGVPLQLEALWSTYAPLSFAPLKKPALSIPISGVNYGKPYPPPGGTKDLPPPNPPRKVEAPRPAPTTAFAAPTPQTAVQSPAARTAPPPSALSEQTPKPAARPIALDLPRPATPKAPTKMTTRDKTTSDPSVHTAWVSAYQEAQRHTAEAHAAYQRAMADSHIAFLQMAESSFAGLSAMVTGGEMRVPQVHAAQSPRLETPRPATLPTYAPEAAATAPREVAHTAPAAPSVTTQPPVEAAPPAVQAAPVARPAPPAVDLHALLLAIVAEKTGYPTDMLNADMALEADLGIDSIKRVEILSAMRERAPGLGEVKPAELANLRTLGQIVDHMRAQLGSSATPPVEAAKPTAPAVDLHALLLTIVAEKTGYPTEMLNADMALEADLGIDSIKRVEILSAMRERAPGLGEVKPAELANLRTLGQIVDHMRAQAGTSVVAPPAQPAARAAADPSTPSVDLEALMLQIVSEKTGYPAEMLGTSMELEADLGIDSIKRVEILSAMRERAPGLPEVKPAELAALRTLGQIIDHMRNAGAPVAAAGTTPLAAATTVNSAGAVSRFAVREVLAPAVGMALSGLFETGPFVVTDDGTGLAALVASELLGRKIHAEVVRSVPADAHAVIYLGGMRDVKGAADALAVNRDAFSVARTIAGRFTKSGGVFVTVQDTGGNFGLPGLAADKADRAWLGGVSALARTAALEWPKASVKAIDCEHGSRTLAAVAKAIVDELFEGGATLEVGLHADGTRTSLTTEVTGAPTGDQITLAPSSVVVASGGARGVTAASLIALAKAQKPCILLLGRTPIEAEPAELQSIKDEKGLTGAIAKRMQASGQKPNHKEIAGATARILANREVVATIDALKGAGSKVRYVSCDVQNAADIATSLEAARKEWGPISAIVHGAGVISDKLLEEKTDEQFDRVFNTKVNGLRAILDATANDPLVSITLFSSVAARTGNLGQSDYAMANEVLNLVACAERARRGAGCVVRSIGWGPWDGGMVTPALKGHFDQMGVTLIPEGVGASMFAKEAVTVNGDVTIVIGGAVGDGPLGAKDKKAVSVDVVVTAASHPELGDHRVGNVAVVPVAMVIEWFLRACRAACPTLVCTSLRDLKVLRGIKLAHFDSDAGEPDHLTVRATPVGLGAVTELQLELRGKNAALHYSATATMAATAATPSARTADPKVEPSSKGTVYDGHTLFHGPKFHVIRNIAGISSSGIVGELSGAAERGWGDESSCSDTALIDGGLQLAVLWGKRVMHGASLPMAVREYRSYRAGLADGPVHAAVHARATHSERAEADISFTDAHGALMAEMLGVELVLRPGERTTDTTAAVVLS